MVRFLPLALLLGACAHGGDARPAAEPVPPREVAPGETYLYLSDGPPHRSDRPRDGPGFV